MSTLISINGLIVFADDTGMIYSLWRAGIDAANLRAMKLVNTDLNAVFGPTGTDAGDYAQQNEWFPFAQGIYQALGAALNAAGLPNSSPFGAVSISGGSFGSGQGMLNRTNLFGNVLFSWFEGMRKQIARYSAGANSGTIDLSTHAAYNNGQAAFSELFSGDFAAAYWYAYKQSPQLDAALTMPYSPVFAPQGIQLATFTLSAVNTGATSNAATTNWPSQNGYSTPAPTNTGPGNDRGAWSSLTAYVKNDAVSDNGVFYVAVAGSTNVTPGTDITKWVVNTFGNNVYIGNMPMAQWFSPMKSAQAHVTTNINGPCPLSVTAPAYDSSGTSHAARLFTATLDNDMAGTVVQLTPTVSGDRMSGVPTAICVAGAAIMFAAYGAGSVIPTSNTSGISNPSVAPTLSQTGTGSSISTGNTIAAYSYVTAAGESQISPTTTLAMTSGQNLVIGAIGSLPAGVVGINYYISQSVGSSTLKKASGGTGPASSGAFNIESGTAERTII